MLHRLQLLTLKNHCKKGPKVASKQNAGAVALRYANALVEIAADSQKIDVLERDLYELECMISRSADFQKMMFSPVLSRQVQQQAIAAIAQKAEFQDITINFLCLLAQNRRLNLIGNMIQAIRMNISTRRGEVRAHVASAFPLSAQQERDLQEAMAKAMGKAVSIQLSVQEDLIGGMVVTAGSKIIDDSIKRKLERLKIAMKANANSNDASEQQVNQN